MKDRIMTDNKRRKLSFNKIMTLMIVIGFAIAAVAFISSMRLTENMGSLEENVSYELPAGYELADDPQNGPDDKYYVRETDETLETINVSYYYDESNYSDNDRSIKIDDSTAAIIEPWDWTNDEDNLLDCEIKHDWEVYHVQYQCREKDKENYYSSCSQEQQDELLGFIKTFDYHRPAADPDSSIFQKLHKNLGTGGCIVLVLALMFFIGLPVAMGIAGAFGKGTETESEGKATSSKELHDSMNRERTARGESSLPSINNVQGASSNNLARMDHSWSSVPDFFIKMFTRKDRKDK